MSTEVEEGKFPHDHPAYQRSNSTKQQEPMQKFLQSLRQQQGSLSPTTDLLNDFPESNVQKYPNRADLPVSTDDVPAADSTEDPFEKQPPNASIPPPAVA